MRGGWGWQPNIAFAVLGIGNTTLALYYGIWPLAIVCGLSGGVNLLLAASYVIWPKESP